jgi:hypothetical protein
MRRAARRWSSVRRALFAPAALCAAVACAGAPKDPAATPVASNPAVESPQINRGSSPQLRIPASSSGRAPVRVEIEVMVDAEGRPDMRTFKATGVGADLNRDALFTWIEGSSFRPARLEGRSVPGLFRMRLEASTRRM